MEWGEFFSFENISLYFVRVFVIICNLNIIYGLVNIFDFKVIFEMIIIC